MIHFNFFVYPMDSNLSGFEMGGMEIQVSDQKITSENHIPNQDMMIFISLCDLLNGLLGLVTSKSKRFSFTATDSAFTILFEKTKTNQLNIVCGKTILKTNCNLFVQQCHKSIDNFYNLYVSKIDANDAVMNDLKNSLDKWK